MRTAGPATHDAPLPAEVTVQDVFLSPRVIDRRAYAELAAEIRALIERSGAERAGLTAALDQAGRATQEFRQRELAQQGNLELAARALKTLDERSGRVEALVARATDAANAVERVEAAVVRAEASVEARAAAIVESKIASLEARMEAVCSAAAARTEALEERLKRATRELEQRIDAIRRDAQSIVAPAAGMLEGLVTRAEAQAGPGQGTLRWVVERAEGLRERTAESLERLEGACRWADAGREDMDRWLETARERLLALTEQRSALAEAERTLAADCERLTRAISEARDGAERSVAEACERARGAVEATRGEAETAVARACEQAERSAREARESAERAVAVTRDAAERSIADARAAADREAAEACARIVEAARAEVSRSAGDAASQAQAALDRAQALAATLDARLNEARTQADKAVADTLAAGAAFRPQIEGASRELAQTIARCQDAQNTTSLALRLLDKSQAQAGALLDRLAPWQPLLEGKPDAAVPEPIQRLINAVRGELRTDLASIAGALRTAAARADRALGAVDAPPPAPPVPSGPVAQGPRSLRDAAGAD